MGGGFVVAESPVVGLGLGPSLSLLGIGGWLSLAVSLPLSSPPQAMPEESVSSSAPRAGRTRAGPLGGGVGRNVLEAMLHFGRPRG
jgi:hypothetical protein